MKHIFTIAILFFVINANAQTTGDSVKVISEKEFKCVIPDLPAFGFYCYPKRIYPKKQLETTMLPPAIVVRHYFGISYWD